jgi:N12 class adenine-specific DNA methylase
MDRAGRNKILPRRRARKPEEERFKNRLEEENGAKKTADSNRQDQYISITPLGLQN